MSWSYVLRWTVRGWNRAGLVYLGWLAAPLATGATTSYIQGDDYWWDYEFPFPFAIPRFISVQTNVVHDMYTGLTWVADPSQLGGIWGSPGTPYSMTWAEAVDRCAALNYGGHSDWRLPNANELQSLADFGRHHPAINEDRFPGTQDDDYWCSSMTHYGCDNEFDCDFSIGGRSWYQDLDSECYVRPVRGQMVPWFKTSLNIKR